MASNVKDFLDLIKEIRGTTFNTDGTPKTGLWAEVKAWHTAVGTLKAANDVAAAAGAASAATGVTQANTATAQAGISTTQAGISTTQAGVATTQATNAGVSASTATAQAVISTAQASAAIAQANNAIGSATTAAVKAAETVAFAGQAATSATSAAASASTATTKATEAAASAVAAADSKNQASAVVVTVTTSALQAASSATSAGTSATTASAKATETATNAALSRRWANELEDVTINDGTNTITYSAFHWARKAASSVAALANGVTTFLHLTDTPDGYGTNVPNRYIKVNAAGNGLEFDVFTKDDAGLANVDNTSDVNKPVSTPTQTALNLKQSVSDKDATGGYAGLTLFAHNMRNVANTITSFLTNTATAARTWTLPDKDGIVAMTNDLVAGSITNAPAGNIAAVTVQAALNELDAEKAKVGSLAGSGITGAAASGANSDITSLSAIASINGGQLAGMRNVIINGACNVQQRGSLTVPVGVVGYGGPDRFYAANVGAGGQFTQAASTLTFGGQVKDAVRHTVNTITAALTTTNHWGGITQYIEGLNAYHLKDKPFVVSFIFNTNVTGTYSVCLRDGPAGYSYVSTFAAVANTPVKVIVTIPVIPSAASIPRTNGTGLSVVVGFLNQATYQTATLNAWLTGNFITASTQTIWAATAGNFIELTDLQLEEGTVATPFERRSYGQELALCQRYHQRFDGAGGTTGIGAGRQTTTTTTRFTIPINPMRAPATVAFTGGLIADIALANPVISAINTAYIGTASVMIDVTNAAGGAAGAGALLQISNGGGNALTLSAEL